MEEWLDAQAGPGVIGGIAENAVLDKRYVKAERERLLSAAFMIRVIVLWTLMPEAQLSDVIIALAGDLAMVPWSKRWRPASERACLDWRKALGPAPLEELQAAVLRAAGDEHGERAGQAVAAGRARPLAVHSGDGSASRSRCSGSATAAPPTPSASPSTPPPATATKTHSCATRTPDRHPPRSPRHRLAPFTWPTSNPKTPDELTGPPT